MNDEVIEDPKRAKTRGEKIFSIATSLLLAVAILFCGYVMLQMKRDGYVTVFGYSVFHVVSGSMEPAIPVGTLIVSQKTDIQDIDEGDIITFRSLETYMLDQMVTHRVIGIEEIDGEIALRTRGDANNSEDGHYVTASNLVGRVVYQTPGENIFKTLYDFLTTKKGFFAIVVVPVLLLAAVILHENVKKIKREIANIKREVERIQEEDSQDSQRIRATGEDERSSAGTDTRSIPDDEINQERSEAAELPPEEEENSEQQEAES